MKQVYSPKEVDIAFGGYNVDGWDSLTIERNGDNTSTNVSADGKVAYSYSADTTGKFDVEVQQQNSSANAFFASIQAVQDKYKLPVFYDITITEKSGGVMVQMSDVHLQRPANQSLSAEAGGREWGFFVEELLYNPEASADKENFANAVIDAAKDAVDDIVSDVKNGLVDSAINGIVNIAGRAL